MTVPIDFDPARLMRLRLVVARFGEMDRAQWWSTQGVLGRSGRQLFSRSFEQTHAFARARVVMEVARARSQAYFDVPGAITLWSLPADAEGRLSARWGAWLEQRSDWEAFFVNLEELAADDLLEALETRALITPEQAAEAAALKRSGEGRGVSIGERAVVDDDTLALLAAGFARGERGKPAIPYARLA